MIVGGFMKQDGFSLVELLAVIVILALIAFIAVPLVLGIIEDSRKSAFASSIEGVKKAIENDYSDRNFDVTSQYVYEDGQLFLVKGSNRTSIPISGSPSGKSKGVGSITATGTVRVAIYSDSYCGYTGTADHSGVTIVDASTITEQECLNKIN